MRVWRSSGQRRSQGGDCHRGAAVRRSRRAAPGGGGGGPAQRPGGPAGFLQGELDESVGERHGVVAAGEAVEVADIPAGKALAVETPDALDLERRRLAARGALTPPIIEGELVSRLVARPPATHAARIEAQDVGRLQPPTAPLNARTMTSWIFMARSTAASAQSMVTSLDHGSMGDRPKSGHFTCSRERTDHVLLHGRGASLTPPWRLCNRAPRVEERASRISTPGRVTIMANGSGLSHVYAAPRNRRAECSEDSSGRRWATAAGSW